MTDIELIVQYMQQECVIAHSHAGSVDGFALWPVVIANAIWLGDIDNTSLRHTIAPVILKRKR